MKFMEIKDDARRIYSLGTIPADVNWGPGRLNNVMSRNGNRALFMATGKVHSVEFRTVEGRQALLDISLHLLREVDKDKMNRLLRRSFPKTTRGFPDLLKITRVLNPQWVRVP